MQATRIAAVALAGAALGLPAAAQARPEGPPARVLLRAPTEHQASVVAHRHATRAERLRGRAVELRRKLDRAKDRKVRVRAERRRVDKAAVPTLEHRVHTLHVKLAAVRTPAPAHTAAAGGTATTASGATSGGASPTLQAIAACESGGNPSANTGNGFYGKYQFTQSTWQAVGGSGNPAAAPEAEQDARAAQLYAQQGSAPWPVCGR